MTWAEYVLDIKEKVYPFNVIIIWAALAFGVIGSIICFFVLVTLWKMDVLKSRIDLKLGFIMTFLDFNSAGGLIVIGIISLSPNPFIITVKPVCSVMNILLCVTFHSSIYLVSILSLERYLLIVHNRKLPDAFYWTVLTTLVLITGILCIVEAALDMNDIDRVYYICLFNPTTDAGLTAYGIMFVLGICCITTSLFCYTSIALKVRLNSLKSVEELGLDRDKVRRESRKTIIKSPILGTFILIDYLPQLISYVITLQTRNWAPLKWNFFAILFLGGYVIVDPLILLTINDGLNKQFMVLIGSWKQRIFH